VPFEEIWEEETTVAEIWPEAPAEWGSSRVYCGDIYAHMFMGSLVHTSTVVLTDERRRAVGAFDQTLSPVGEDYEYHFRTCALGCVAFVDVPTIHYQVGAGDQLTAGHLAESIARSNLITIQRAWDRD